MNSSIIPLPNGDFTTEEYLIKNDCVEVVVHTFSVGDVEDPDLWAAEPLWSWQESEQGKWVMAHAIETPIWQRIIDQNLWSYKYKITAMLPEKDYTFWVLKWGNINERR